MGRRRSRPWWSVFLFAVLATGAYIAFDVLDVDGSDLRGRPASGTAVAEPARTEAEGRLRQDPLTPETPGVASAVPAHRVAALNHRAAPYAATAITVARRHGFLARAHTDRAAARSDSQSSDPA